MVQSLLSYGISIEERRLLLEVQEGVARGSPVIVRVPTVYSHPSRVPDMLVLVVEGSAVKDGVLQRLPGPTTTTYNR